MTTPQTYDISGILARHPREETALIEILHDIQLAFRHLPRTVLGQVAQHVNVPLSRVASVGTFYKAFSFTPKGETTVRICMGTACHVRGARLILDEAQRALDVGPGQTTPDGKFTLEEVNCVGACAMAPVVIENETYHGFFKAVDMKKLCDKGASK
jgi:NADH-quinone oxidoreductase subunit E